MISVITPTYNRAYILNNAYTSLKRQSYKDLEWIIIDDGSSDNTEELVKSFIKENELKINYIKKENGGKHTALNIGFKEAKGELLMILDSDDTLTENALEKVSDINKKYKSNKKIACYSFLKMYPDNKIVGKRYEGNEIISNHINFRYNKNLNGDMEEVFKTEVIKNYQFPVFGNERFLGEGMLWRQIAYDYDTVYINEPIYICDYLEDGLSKNVFKLITKNPIGALTNANEFLEKRCKVKKSLKIREAILYIAYSKFDNRSFNKIQKESNNKLLTFIMYPVGLLAKTYIKSKLK